MNNLQNYIEMQISDEGYGRVVQESEFLDLCGYLKPRLFKPDAIDTNK